MQEVVFGDCFQGPLPAVSFQVLCKPISSGFWLVECSESGVSREHTKHSLWVYG